MADDIRVSIRAADAATLAEVERELEALRGQEPSGAELLDDPSPRPKAMDPLLTTLMISLVAGFASGIGKEVGERALAWLVSKIKAAVKKRGGKVTMKVAGVELEVNEHTDPAELSSKFTAALGAKP